MQGLSDGRAYARVYQLVNSNASPDTGVVTPHQNNSGDVLFFYGGSSFSPGFVSDVLPVSSILGLSKHREEFRYVSSHLTDPPENSPFSSYLDDAKYGSHLTIHTSSCDTSEATAHLREKQVLHSKYVGDLSTFGALYPRFIPNPYENYAFAGHGDPMDTFKRRGGGLDPLYDGAIATGVNDQGFLTFSPVGVSTLPPASIHVNAYDRAMRNCEYMKDGTEIGSIAWVSGRPTWYRWSLFSNKSFHNDNYYNIDIDYRFSKEWLEYGYGRVWSEYRTHISVRLWFGESFGTNLAFDPNSFPPDVCRMEDTSTTELISTRSDFDVTITPWRLVLTRPPYLFTDIGQNGAEYFDNFDNYRRNGTSSVLSRSRSLTNSVSKRMRDIRPSSFLASAAGLENQVGILQANNLQNLQHLKDVLELIPDLGKLSEILMRLTKGDLAALKDLVDFITEAILQYNYAQRPLIKDGKELTQTDLLASLDRLLKTKSFVIYGDFKYIFPDYENFIGPGKLVLETRSKVKAHLDMSTLMMSYLCANSLGLMPTLARIWSLIPFSFVVDWFTNMSKRLRLVDDQVLWMATRTAWCLYSYTLTYYPTDAELATYGLYNVSDSTPFGISVYTREFSRVAPRLSESSFDFLRPTKGPDPVTVGALVWQLIF